MSSRTTARIGAQKPRLLVRQKRHYASDGADAAELARAFANAPDPWQEDVLDAWLARDRYDHPVYLTMILSVPRQNGKNDIIQDFELYKMVVCGEGILHTAHQVKTANKAFQKLCRIFESNDELRELVVNIRRTNGEQGIYLTNGGFIEYSARSRGASRGNTYSVLVIDEAQEYTDEQAEALMPTLAASPSGYRQIVYTGTPPPPGSPGTIFERLRKQAIKKPSKTMCFHEWSIESLPKEGTTYDELQASVIDVNPAYGVRLDDDFTREEFATMTLEGFARERLGWWSDQTSSNAVFSAEDWRECEIESIPESDDEKVCAGVKFTPDGENVAVSVAVKQKKECFIECVFYEPMSKGTTWLAEWIESRKHEFAEVWIDGKVHSSALVQKLLESDFPNKAIRPLSTHDVVDASSILYDAVVEKKVHHTNQPLLTQSALATQKRPIGDKYNGGWGFGDGTTSCAPIESASYAYKAVLTSRRNPKRKLRVG